MYVGSWALYSATLATQCTTEAIEGATFEMSTTHAGIHHSRSTCFAVFSKLALCIHTTRSFQSCLSLHSIQHHMVAPNALAARRWPRLAGGKMVLMVSFSLQSSTAVVQFRSHS